ncbi:uncharacterized protein LOC114524223 isoform X2 [Dendronephthya gigantea]|uniref:uncharacterized protein LOC114524215 isoform X1 n=1 Tax=Dendronephthya gigantea TaxID=151771 RepID=UPI001069F593|nr:uncharacterized protein LOC114524215 isoform X1 [Dendronephthya gigantea]XP_028401167.1 uncharacterized protein LOC114524223 isoform X2 [Dendronephthya gigantea]
MARVLEFYSARVSALATWSEELRKEQESPESTGLLVMVLSEKDTLDIVLLHLNSLFAPYMDEHAALPEDDGIFLTCDEADKFEMELDDDAGNEDRESELEEENVLDILVSVLNEEYGTDYEYSDEEKSDEEDELISIKDSILQSFS